MNCMKKTKLKRSLRPTRIQLSRRKGWRMPANTVKVDRTTRWGNIFVPDGGRGPLKLKTVEDAVRCHRIAVENDTALHEEIRATLRGKNLACWCPLGSPCHADVLLEIANA